MFCGVGKMTSWLTFWRRSDACQGDSGGPLVCLNKVSGRWYLQGLTSWGKGCGSMWYPGIYSKITAARGWVESVMQAPRAGNTTTTPLPTDRCPDFAQYKK